MADTSPLATSAPTKPPPDLDKGVDDDTEDPEVIKRIEQAEQGYFAWLRSDYVKNLDPRGLSQGLDPALRPGDLRTFEDAVDWGDLVVSGQVKELLFIPFGTVTTFQVDRTAKGEPGSTVYVLQTGFVEPHDGNSRETGNAQVIYDPGLPMLFEGDRAVLVLKEIPELEERQAEFLGDRLGGAPVYEIVRGRGLYRTENGTVRSDKHNTPARNPDRSFDGKTADELMDTAETYAKDKRISYKSPSPSAP